jgi:hypothetical protein
MDAVSGRWRSRLLFGVTFAAGFSLFPATGLCQFFNNVGGVSVNAEGMLTEAAALTAHQRLERLKQTAIEPGAPAAASGGLRKVSLRLLEQAVVARRERQQPLSADMRFLAGLTELRYVFFDPERGDVVLAGPSDQWELDRAGYVVGKSSRRPVLSLDDLVVALRVALADRSVAAWIGCSIDPTEAGVKKHAAALRSLDGRLDAAQVKRALRNLEDAAGPQTVSIYGAPASSPLALKLVAADYRLKRIAMGHDPAPADGLSSYLDLVAAHRRNPSDVRPHRWWLQGHYNAIEHTADHSAYQFHGEGLKVVTAPTWLAPGRSKRNGQPDADAQEFAATFTRLLATVAEAAPAFAELQNVVALSVAVELIARRASDGAWKPVAFLDEATYRVPKYRAPERAPALAAERRLRGGKRLFAVSGGVEINAAHLIDDAARLASGPALAELRNQQRSAPDDNYWWWD